MVLRKCCSQAILDQIQQIGFDRILEFTLVNRDELGDTKRYKLYIELMGKYSNIVLVDHNGIIIDNSEEAINLFSLALFSYKILLLSISITILLTALSLVFNAKTLKGIKKIKRQVYKITAFSFLTFERKCCKCATAK